MIEQFRVTKAYRVPMRQGVPKVGGASHCEGN